jgi:hypothetical protein
LNGTKKSSEASDTNTSPERLFKANAEMQVQRIKKTKLDWKQFDRKKAKAKGT